MPRANSVTEVARQVEPLSGSFRQEGTSAQRPERRAAAGRQRAVGSRNPDALVPPHRADAARRGEGRAALCGWRGAALALRGFPAAELPAARPQLGMFAGRCRDQKVSARARRDRGEEAVARLPSLGDGRVADPMRTPRPSRCCRPATPLTSIGSSASRLLCGPKSSPRAPLSPGARRVVCGQPATASIREYGAASASGVTDVTRRAARRHTSSKSARVRSLPPTFTIMLRSLR